MIVNHFIIINVLAYISIIFTFINIDNKTLVLNAITMSVFSEYKHLNVISVASASRIISCKPWI